MVRQGDGRPPSRRRHRRRPILSGRGRTVAATVQKLRERSVPFSLGDIVGPPRLGGATLQVVPELDGVPPEIGRDVLGRPVGRSAWQSDIRALWKRWLGNVIFQRRLNCSGSLRLCPQRRRRLGEELLKRFPNTVLVALPIPRRGYQATRRQPPGSVGHVRVIGAAEHVRPMLPCQAVMELLLELGQ